MNEAPQPYKLPTRYKLRQKKGRVKDLPVSVVDVDDLHVWLMIERDEQTQWHVGLSWSRIVKLLADDIMGKNGLEADYQELMRRKREGLPIGGELLTAEDTPGDEA